MIRMMFCLFLHWYTGKIEKEVLLADKTSNDMVTEDRLVGPHVIIILNCYLWWHTTRPLYMC